MAISNYSELQTAVGNWLNRSDLSTRIPEFIALAEADMRRVLRDQVTRAAFILTSDAVALPATADEVRSLRFNDSTRKYPLTQVTHETLAGLRRSGSGVPHYFSVLAGSVLLDVTPVSNYTMEIVYYTKLVPLATASTNATLTESPDIYLFGALKEAAPYLEHDERNPMWSQKYQKAVDDENVARERAELGAAPAIVRLPINFG